MDQQLLILVQDKKSNKYQYTYTLKNERITLQLDNNPIIYPKCIVQFRIIIIKVLFQKYDKSSSCNFLAIKCSNEDAIVQMFGESGTAKFPR